MSKEIWKDVVGYEGLYQVSNVGRVKSLSRIVGNNRRLKEKILKPHQQCKGYLEVALYSNGIRIDKLIHRLVGIAFIPNPENLPEINHKNEIKTDNRVENLEWITRRSNQNYTVNKKSSSKYPGVTKDRNYNVWLAHCHYEGKKHYLGSYRCEEDAAQAYIYVSALFII